MLTLDQKAAALVRQRRLSPLQQCNSADKRPVLPTTLLLP